MLVESSLVLLHPWSVQFHREKVLRLSRETDVSRAGVESNSWPLANLVGRSTGSRAPKPPLSLGRSGLRILVHHTFQPRTLAFFPPFPHSLPRDPLTFTTSRQLNISRFVSRVPSQLNIPSISKHGAYKVGYVTRPPILLSSCPSLLHWGIRPAACPPLTQYSVIPTNMSSV